LKDGIELVKPPTHQQNVGLFNWYLLYSIKTSIWIFHKYFLHGFAIEIQILFKCFAALWNTVGSYLFRAVIRCTSI